MILDDVLPRAEWALLSLALATVLVAAALLLARTTLRRRPAARAAAFQAVSALLLLVPAWAVVVARFDLGQRPADSPVADTFTEEDAAGFDPQIGNGWGDEDDGASVAAVPASARAGEADHAKPSRVVERVAWVVWLGGLVVVLLPLAGSWLRVRSLRRGLRPCLAAWETSLARLGDAPAAPALATSDAVDGPVTIGLRRPVIVLPAAMGDAAPTAGHAAVLAHELAHVRRRDALRAVLDCLVVAVYWFHPLVWRFVRDAAIAREDVCDNHALAVTSPESLARTLFELAQTRSNGRSSAGVLSPAIAGWDLETRIDGLLDTRRDDAPRVRPLRAAVVFALGLGASGVLVVACSHGRDDAPADHPVLVAGTPDDGAAREDGVDDPVAAAPGAVELDPVLLEHGFGDLASVELEFVWDHDAGNGPFRLPDGRTIPPETSWRFPRPDDFLRVLRRVPIESFVPDRWLEAKAELVVAGTTSEGLHAQISFHSVPGRATISLVDPRGGRRGGELRVGDLAPLRDLMRTRAPSVVSLALGGVNRRWLSPAEAPDRQRLRVLRDPDELARAFGDRSWELPDDAPEGTLGLLFQAPAGDPPGAFFHGGATLYDGVELAQLVFFRDREAADVDAGWGSELLVLVRVPDPAAIRSVRWVQPGRKETEIRLE